MVGWLGNGSPIQLTVDVVRGAFTVHAIEL